MAKNDLIRAHGNEENDVDPVISNPIHIYNLIKEMTHFAENVYHPLLNISEDIGFKTYLLLNLSLIHI